MVGLLQVGAGGVSGSAGRCRRGGGGDVSGRFGDGALQFGVGELEVINGLGECANEVEGVDKSLVGALSQLGVLQ